MVSSKPERRELTVTSEPGLPTTPQGERERLDHYLGRQFGDLSRSRAEALIKDGAVTVDGRRPKGSRPVTAGQVIVLLIPPVRETQLEPEDIPLDIRYEDPHLVVVNKPPGMVVHPAPGHPSGTLVNALIYHCRDLSGIGGVLRPGIVHRLDKDTSGLLVVAKSQAVHASLSEAMKQRRIRRTYIAVVWGHPDPEEGSIETWIGRSRGDRKRMAAYTPRDGPLEKRWGRPGEEELSAEIARERAAVPLGVPRGARPAVTRYRTLTHYDIATSVECALETGRTHQVRVHFSYRGHPVVGDPTYGGRHKAVRGLVPEQRAWGKSLLEVMPRQALHAARLQFDHPVSGEEMIVEAALPEDIQRLMQQLAAT